MLLIGRSSIDDEFQVVTSPDTCPADDNATVSSDPNTIDVEDVGCPKSRGELLNDAAAASGVDLATAVAVAFVLSTGTLAMTME
mmetsp:Transcript_3935/g.8732  ORF Transcript_3935/g.8732 Transcript_3935/m.8732 type:complete len:84 (+) Transcript_3935:1214-1465(+)